MASDKQTEANRANAQKSTGPTSQAGRDKVSRNATRHGLLARTVVLDRESKDRFLLHVASFYEAMEPATQIEYDLVDNMAIARWKLMRLWDMERASLNQRMQRQEAMPVLADDTAEAAAPGIDPSHSAALAFQTLGDESRVLDLITRYETSFERMYSRALDRLMKLRAKRFFSQQSDWSVDPDQS